MVHSVGRAAGWSTAGLYAVSRRRRREQSAGNRGNLFQDLADFFFFLDAICKVLLLAGCF